MAGLPFDALREPEVVELVIENVRRGRGGRIVTPNVDILRQATRDPALAELVAKADLVLADGMPVVWASRLAGRPLPERVAGSSLGPLLAARAAPAGVGMFLLGARDHHAERAAGRLRAAHPTLRVGWHFPPFGFERDERQFAAIEEAVGQFGPCICLIGLGFPKQDQVARRLLANFPSSWFIGVGAAVDFIAGERSRAPVSLQRMGLEWVFRLALEPRRLAGRYLRRDIAFAVRLLAGASLEGLMRRYR